MAVIKKISGYEVYNSPEFVAFCDKFGIAHSLPTRSITITITEENLIVDQSYIGVHPNADQDHRSGSGGEGKRKGISGN